MKKSLVMLGVAVAAVLLATPALAQNRGVSFTPIGYIDPPGPAPASMVLTMNTQGTQFIASPDFRGSYAAFWTREGGWGDQIGSIGGGARLGDNGTVMANGLYPGANYAWPGVWLGVKDSWAPIPADPGYVACGSSRIGMYDMSLNGDYAVGLTWGPRCLGTGFLWDKATNTTISLGTPNGRSTRANAVTADGSKVIGWGTALFGTRRGATWQNGTWTFINDPLGREPKGCKTTGKPCTANSADPLYGCPGDYVDDGSCPASSKGVCTSGVCVGGYDAGKTCTNNGQCGGTCAGGPNNGLRCTSDYYCPDTPACLPNPNWTDDLFKGEAFDATADGRFAVGRNFDYSAKWNSGYRYDTVNNTFTEIPVLPDFPEIVNPLAISDNGKMVVGFAGGQLVGFAPLFWTEATGTVDLQLFLAGQGLDEIFFWYILQANSVSADGLTIAGYGVNPDALYEGFVVDLHKVWICHAPPGNPANERTLGIAFNSVGDHLAHGDFLGTCEFKNSSGLSRAASQRQQLRSQYASILKVNADPTDPASNSWQWTSSTASTIKPTARTINTVQPKRTATKAKKGR